MFISSLIRRFLSVQLSSQSGKRRSIRTKVKRKGILSRLLSLVAPIVSFADKMGLRLILDFTVILFIQAYQKYLSPQKGFSCAYSRLHNTESCSEYFRQTVKTYGLAKAIPLFQQRLRECKLAYAILKAQHESKEKDKRCERK